MAQFNPNNFTSCNGRILSLPNVKILGEKRRGTFLFATKKKYKNKQGFYDSTVFPVVVWNADIDFIEKHFVVGQHCHLVTELDAYKKGTVLQLQLVLSSLTANETKAAVLSRQQGGEPMETSDFSEFDSYFSSEYGVEE